MSAMRQAFIEQMMPLALQASQKTGVDPRIIIAQGALESGWGKSAPGNNYFGIKSHGLGGGNNLATTEVVNGSPVRTTDSFRSFNGMADSVNGYVNFINSNPRYNTLKSSTGLDTQIQALAKSGYATDPDYGNKIASIARSIGLPDGTPPMQAALQSPETPEAPTSGSEGSDALAGGAGADTLSTGSVAQPPSMWDNFMSGGPGALFGKPQEGWNAGDALMGAGVALMSRDNPTGAAALASALRYSKDGKTKASAKQVVRQDAKSGQVTVYDPETNSFKTQQVFDRAPEDPKSTDQKYFGENASAADKFAEGVDIFDKHRRRLANNEVDLSVLDRVQQSAAELLNTPLTPAQRNAVELSLDLEKMRNDKLLEAKGVQTEGDADRAMRAIMPGAGKYNTDAVLTALDKGYAATQRMYDRALQNNDAYYRRYGDRIADSEYGNRRQATLDRWKKSEEEFTPIRENYYKTRQSQGQQAQESITGRPQMTRQGSDAAPQYRDGQTATNPQTKQKMIFRNGRWENM